MEILIGVFGGLYLLANLYLILKAGSNGHADKAVSAPLLVLVVTAVILKIALPDKPFDGLENTILSSIILCIVGVFAISIPYIAWETLMSEKPSDKEAERQSAFYLKCFGNEWIGHGPASRYTNWLVRTFGLTNFHKGLVIKTFSWKFSDDQKLTVEYSVQTDEKLTLSEFEDKRADISDYLNALMPTIPSDELYKEIIIDELSKLSRRYPNILVIERINFDDTKISDITDEFKAKLA